MDEQMDMWTAGWTDRPDIQIYSVCHIQILEGGEWLFGSSR
jgi:hypothetical protein